MSQLIRQVFGVQAPHQVLRIVIVCIEPRQQQNKVGVTEADVFLPNVRNIVKVAAGGCRRFRGRALPGSLSKVECSLSYGYMFSFQARAASSRLDGGMAWWFCSSAARV